jgi:hypothetical protein
MKITGVRTKLYEHDMLRPLGDAGGEQGFMKFLPVRPKLLMKNE